MKNFKKAFIYLSLITIYSLLSCTTLDEEIEFTENEEIEAAEKTMRRGGINDYVGCWSDDCLGKK
jgi:hypothetical protein